MTQKTCYFFGTFNPIHIGHLLMASQAVALKGEALGFESVTLIPAASPPNKQGIKSLIPAIDRYNLIQQAIYGLNYLKASDIELDLAVHATQGQPVFTSDVLANLQTAGKNVKAVMLTGQDTFLSLPTWHNLPDILQKCHFLVLRRPGTPDETPSFTVPDLPDISWEALDAPEMYVSATHIRRLCRIFGQNSLNSAGQARLWQALSLLIPGKALDYFVENRLYLYFCNELQNQG